MVRFKGSCLVTDDVLSLSRFYSEVLGAPVEGDATHSVLIIEGASLVIFSTAGMEDMAPGSMAGAGRGALVLEFQVEDVDAEHARLLAKRIPIVKPPKTYPWGTRSVWFRDPDGNILNFFQPVS